MPAASVFAGKSGVEPAAPRSLWDRLTDAVGLGVAYSVLLHAVLLLLASVVVYRTVSTPRASAVTAGEVSDTPAAFDTVADLNETAGGEPTEPVEVAALLTPAVFDALEVAPPPTEPVPTQTSSADLGANGVKGRGRGDSGGGGRLLAPENAVSEGRFTAWTQPIPQRPGERPKAGDAPRPGQAYHIVIELELPKTLRRYSINDLKGVIVGTDGYKSAIPRRTFYMLNNKPRPVRPGTRLPILDNRVQVLVYVPGGDELVRDKILLGSRRLAETQQLELVFGT